ncbi:TonB-dependent siderophore receptor, partial [Arcobacter lanthieri]|uniref:TonB-dependent siderophore receptor n=1 Tax=Aliarcobacter lanthieri TaxID=1355374 RepID=UPI0019209E63
MNFSKHSLVASSLLLLLGMNSFADEVYTIQNKTLKEALEIISKKSNLSYIANDEVLDKKSTNNIQNIEGTQQALDKLLEGSGLKAIIDDKSIVIVQEQGNIKVVNGTYILDDVSVSEGSFKSSNSYTVKETSSATKLDMSLKETPQSISVITQKQIEDQNLTDTNDILLQTPGITVQQLGQKTSGHVIYTSRGFSITNYQRDGIPTTPFSFGGDSFTGLEDSSAYEKVEIIRGSTGLTNGSGNPAASINYVRKKPTKEFQGNAKVSYGSWDTYRGMIDISGGLNSNDSIRGRFVASYEEGGNQQDRYKQENSSLYGALDFDLSDNTLLTTAISYQKMNANDVTVHSFHALSSDGNKQYTFGRNDNLAPNWAYSDLEKLNMLVGLEHYFNDDWKAIANYSFSKVEQDRLFGMTRAQVNYNKGTLEGRNGGLTSSGRSEQNPDTHAIDLYTTGNIKAFDREHKLSFGVNGYIVKSDNPTYKLTPNGHKDIPIANYNGNVTKPIITRTGTSKIDTKEIGAFAALNLELSDPLHLIVGARVTNFERINNKGTATEQTQKHNGEIIPYLGLVYDINENFATYASYTSIFNPTTSEDANGKYLDPEKGNTVEFGLKSEFYDGKLNTSIAYYLTKQDNLAISDPEFTGILNPNNKSISKSVDGAEIKGWDLTVGGEIMPNWNISGGYTYTDAKDQNKDRINSAYVPKHTLKLFTSYKYNKFTLGGGVNWQSETNTTDTMWDGISTSPKVTVTTKQKAYALVNAMAKYEVKKDFDVILNVNNLFDEDYRYHPTQG